MNSRFFGARLCALCEIVVEPAGVWAQFYAHHDLMMLIISIVKSSLALSLGLVGALSIERFVRGVAPGWVRELQTVKQEQNRPAQAEQVDEDYFSG